MKKLKHRSILYVLFFAVFIIPSTHGQIIFTSTDVTVYNFLERMSLKGIIQYNDEVKPFSRMAIGKLLLKVEEQKEKLNELEQKELIWQFEEYSAETGYEDERFRLYSHRDSLFELTVSPVAGYSLANNYGKTAYHRWWAFKFWGTYGNYFGASFEYRDNTESGSGIVTIRIERKWARKIICASVTRSSSSIKARFSVPVARSISPVRS